LETVENVLAWGEGEKKREEKKKKKSLRLDRRSWEERRKSLRSPDAKEGRGKRRGEGKKE